MKRLHERSPEQAHEKHLHTPERTYSEDSIQAPRIRAARGTVVTILEELDKNKPAHEMKKIIELGCGMGDICGWFSSGHWCEGWESSAEIGLKCVRRWPLLVVHVGDIQKLAPQSCDILILCEILEHLADPAALCAAWLPLAKHAVISSPLEGDLTGDLSGGEHTWSFTESDLRGFLASGGHEPLHHVVLAMGGYNIWLAASQRQEAEAT